MKVNKTLSVSLGAGLLCMIGAGTLAVAQSPSGKAITAAQDDAPLPDPDPDPGPPPKDPEPLPDNMELPDPRTTKQSYVDDLPKAPEGQEARVATGTICLNAHLQGIGWQGWVCQPSGRVASVGTTGQSRRMEALAAVTFGAGGICAIAHVQNIGWQGWACANDGQVIAVGTTGYSLRMEALGIGTFGSNLCAQAHVAFMGWLGWGCAAPNTATFVGTTGQARRMEALNVVL